MVDGICVGKGGSSYKPTASVTLYARWSDEYTVTYVANGGSIENSSVPVKMNQSVTLPKPSRQGYKFEGWYTSATDGKKIGDAGDSYTPESNVTLYAQWSEVVNTRIVLPVNINQQYYWSTMERKCSVVCAIDISNYYSGKEYSSNETERAKEIQDEINKMIKGGIYDSYGRLVWGNVPYVLFDINHRNDKIPFNEIYQKAVESISTQKPMMIHCFGYYYDNKGEEHTDEHWVIPEKCDDVENPNTDNLIVYDPYTNNSSTCTNETWSLSDSIKTNITKATTPIYFGYVTTSKKP